MNINNLFFHIHYCNMRQVSDPWKYNKKMTRTLNHHEFLLIHAGKGNIIINRKKYEIKEGLIFYICPEVEHHIDIEIESPFYFMSVHFSYVNVLLNESKWEMRNEPEVLPIRPVQEISDYYHINDVFKKLVDTWYGKMPDYELISKAYLQQLIFEILQNEKKQNQNYSTSLKVEKIINHMHQNINGKITLTELSEMVQLAPTYLSKAFKETTGYSIIEFFNKMKIDKAKELIAEGDKKVKDVARELGFNDEFYFSRIFKKIEGVSPTEFYSKNVHGV